MTTEAAAITCPTCGQAQAPEQFYGTSIECKTCKKERSQANRAVIAQKVAVVDRLVAVLEQLVAMGWRPEHLLTTQKTGLEAAITALLEALDRQTGATR